MLYKFKKNKFLKNSVLYTVGSMMTPLLGFIMLPVYTNYLSPSEYGVMTTVQTLVGMLQVFLLLSLHGAVTRFYYDYLEDLKQQKEYLGSIFLFVVFFSTLAASILLLFNQFIGAMLFNEIPTYPFYFYMIGLSWLSALFALPMALIRAQEKAGFFVTVNIAKAVLIMLLSIYLIVFKGLGAESALLSQLIVTALVVLFLFIKQSQYLKISLKVKHIKYSLLFSLPLLPHVASGWIIKSSDRIILEKFVALEELGVYALAAQVSMVLALFYQSVNNALVPRYTMLRKENKEKEAEKLLKIFLIVIISFGVLSIPIAMLGAYLLSSDAYNRAIWLIPFLIIAQIIKGLYYVPVAGLFYIKETKSIATSSSVAAVINLVINFLLIPIIGIYGAIISTVTAELIRIALIYRAKSTLKIGAQYSYANEG
ncbi:oligosaccharide flippase family protein [Halobacillus litoralis]|uniref:Oligosaccharide flippase family protein n=1 Tax=Halobacillus litoralis TaxID=45668 RepID=A0A845F827_9BACI|nr:oligosaccharide flippase family protein [Halobacillus litoralis]MYL69835.1 oligosaccharide flippase family protein [Halobacillus litoralis]